MLAAQQREIRAEVPVTVADRFAERSERVRAGFNEPSHLIRHEEARAGVVAAEF